MPHPNADPNAHVNPSVPHRNNNPLKPVGPKERRYDKKWLSLEARGITKPANARQNMQRIKDAHGY